MKNKIFMGLLLIIMSTVVSADCYMNGVLYPTGTTIGGLTCQADGSRK